MCRSAAEGGRRCTGASCGAAADRQRQRRSRARRALEAAQAAGDPDAIAAAEAKYTAATGDTPPTPEKPMTKPEPEKKPKPEPKPEPTAPEQRIREVWQTLAAKDGDWIRISRIRDALRGDVDQNEITRVLTDMMHRGEGVHLAPDSNTKVLTQADRDGAVLIGGEPKHLLAIEPDYDAAANHIRAVGVRDATDRELSDALSASAITDAFYDEIRTEQRRRLGISP